MTDLHTHILPGVDDGAKDPEESLKLLSLERAQGVDTVVLTPHFYRDREKAESFLHRRAEAMLVLEERLAQLSPNEREALPKLRLGAEVAWWPNLAGCEQLPELCIEGTKNLLLELPFSPWSEQMIKRIYDLMGRTGVTPVIAHLDRYLKTQRAELIRGVLELGVPVQMSGDALLHLLTRGTPLKLLRQKQAHLIASDCHHISRRVPNLGDAMKTAEKKLGKDRAAEMMRCADLLAGI